MKRWLWVVAAGGITLAGVAIALAVVFTRSPAVLEPKIEIIPRFGATVGTSVVFRCLDPGLRLSQDQLRQIRYLWTFGDGGRAEGLEASYRFSRPGQWTVTLTVEAVDRHQRFYQTTTQDKVTVELAKLPEPLAVIDYTPKQIQTDTRVEFDGSRSSPRSPIPEPLQVKWDYMWDFGDGTPRVSGARIAHTFSRPGEYTVRLTATVTDQFNQQASSWTEQRVMVSNRPPVADVRVEPQVVIAGAAVIFDATTTRDPDGEPLYFEWDFDGDGILDAEGARVKYERGFSSPGVYPVKVNIYDDYMRRRKEQPLVHIVNVKVYGNYGAAAGGPGPLGVIASAGLAAVGELRLWNVALGWDFLGGQWVALGAYGQSMEPWVIDRTAEFPAVRDVGGRVETVVERASLATLEAGYRIPNQGNYPVYLLAGVGTLQLHGVHRASCRITIDGSAPPVTFSTTQMVLSVGFGVRWGLGLAAFRALIAF